MTPCAAAAPCLAGAVNMVHHVGEGDGQRLVGCADGGLLLFVGAARPCRLQRRHTCARFIYVILISNGTTGHGLCMRSDVNEALKGKVHGLECCCGDSQYHRLILSRRTADVLFAVCCVSPSANRFLLMNSRAPGPPSTMSVLCPIDT